MEGHCYSSVHLQVGMTQFAFVVALVAMANTVVGLTPPPPPLPLMPLPSHRQLKFQRQEQAMFFHFGVNTFAGNEQGDGTDDPSIFNPTGLVLSLYLLPWLHLSNAMHFVIDHVDASIRGPLICSSQPTQDDDGDHVFAKMISIGEKFFL